METNLFDRPSGGLAHFSGLSGRAEQIPCLTESCKPPEILGTGSLVTAAINGASLDALAAIVSRPGAHPAAALYDTSTLYQIAFHREQALRLQASAIAASPLFRVKRSSERPATVRVLALVAPGDMMTNTPLDFITNHLSDVRLDLLFLVPGQSLPDLVPDHDVMFFAACESDAATLARTQMLYNTWPRPVLNSPAALPLLARDALARLLASIPTILSPKTVKVHRGAFPVEMSYPTLIRPVGSHAGEGLVKLDDAAGLGAYLQNSSAEDFYLTRFVEYHNGQGLYQKYRVAFIDGRPFLCHMAISDHWMVHYLNAEMAERSERRAIEATAMQEFETGFAVRHRDALAALCRVLPLEYFSIDCSELPDGRLLVFEADNAAIVHLMEPAETFAYKHAQMQQVFAAFGLMLHRHATSRSRSQ